MRLLPSVTHHDTPFRFFTADDALPPVVLDALNALYDAELVWDLHADSFYRAWMCEVGHMIDPVLRTTIARRMAALTGLPLVADLKATVQRMEVGQYALPHTDRPLVGYEAARLIVQLTPGWQPEHRGELLIHPDPDGREVALRRPPRLNSAFGMVMSPQSVHSVRPTARQRRTAVFNLWHVGNTEAVATWVKEQLGGLRFNALPRALGPIIDEAESTLPEDATFRAGMVASLLQRWGYPEAVVRSGYQAALNPLTRPEGEPSILFARWVQRLGHVDFDSDLWAALAPTFSDRPVTMRIGPEPAFPRDTP